MKDEVVKLWGAELNWIEDEELRDKTARVWEIAPERSALEADDLNRITFMDDKTALAHIARESGLKVNKFFKDELPVNLDVLISGAILCDDGKLPEYVLDENGNAVQGTYEKYLRHPISGVALAEEVGLPSGAYQIIATHAGECDMVKRKTEANIGHHSDFMTSLPLKNGLKI